MLKYSYNSYYYILLFILRERSTWSGTRLVPLYQAWHSIDKEKWPKPVYRAEMCKAPSPQAIRQTQNRAGYCRQGWGMSANILPRASYTKVNLQGNKLDTSTTRGNKDSATNRYYWTTCLEFCITEVWRITQANQVLKLQSFSSLETETSISGILSAILLQNGQHPWMLCCSAGMGRLSLVSASLVLIES